MTKLYDVNGWLGEYEITITHKNGNVEVQRVKNRLTNAGLNMLRDALAGDVADAEIKYLALGTNDDPLDDTDTQLGTEIFRTSDISKVKPSTGKVQNTYIVLDAEAVGNIREIGVFAGAAAGAGANTGIMVSRILWSRDKTALESIQFVRIDTIGRA